MLQNFSSYFLLLVLCLYNLVILLFLLCCVWIFLVPKCWNTSHKGLGGFKGTKVDYLKLFNLLMIPVVSLFPFAYQSFIHMIYKILFFSRDLPGVLLELSKEFNIEKFLVVLLDSLIDCRWEFYDFLSGGLCILYYQILFCADYYSFAVRKMNTASRLCCPW